MLLILRNILMVLLFSFIYAGASADSFSFVYIQGDKQIPFYVKLEGEMQPRYGKNYCIIPRLAPGPVQIEILFQQNEYPAEKFTIMVPDNGFRGFMLTKKEGVYALYDLQQAFYLSPGNAAEDDIAPVFRNTTEPVQLTNSNSEEPPIASSKPPKEKTEDKAPPKKTKPVATRPKPEAPKEIPEPVDNGEPKFIENIELNNERTLGNGENAQTVESSATDELPKSSISNSDCPKPLPFSEYQHILEKARNKGENSRLKYLLEQTDKCFTTVQVRALTRSLSKDPERYAFLKEIFPHVTDQSNFSMLEATLTSREWKDYFKLILP
jgi:hypothetical protein